MMNEDKESINSETAKPSSVVPHSSEFDSSGATVEDESGEESKCHRGETPSPRECNLQDQTDSSFTQQFSAADISNNSNGSCADKARNKTTQAIGVRESHVTTDEDDVFNSFADLNLGKSLVTQIKATGFYEPSVFQKRAIIPCLRGCDVIGLSYAGTGKSVAWMIAVLHNLQPDIPACQAVVLLPWREKALWVQRTVLSLGHVDNGHGVQCQVAVAGTVPQDSLQPQAGKAGPVITLGTPPRLFTLLQSKALDVTHVKVFVLDEADELLSGGFSQAVMDIFHTLPPGVQVIVMSCTLPGELRELVQGIAKKPVYLSLPHSLMPHPGIKQRYVNVEKDEWKQETVVDLLEIFDVVQAVIVCGAATELDFVTQCLRKNKISASFLNEKMELEQRDAVMHEFQRGLIRSLIMTEPAECDWEQLKISVVINFDLPNTCSAYDTRLRAWQATVRRGIMISLLTTDNMQTLHDIEKFYNITIPELSAEGQLL